MRNVAVALTALVLTVPPPAQADGVGFKGTCDISALQDTTPGGVLGGQRVWNGEVDIQVVANTPGTMTSASCYVKVTASGAESKILDGTVVGGTLGIGAGRATFTADVTDTVYLCTHVTTDAGAEDICVPLTTTPVCPDQVCGDGGVLGPNGLVDSIVCPLLITLAPTVDSLPTAAVLYIDPATGDTFVGGTTEADLFWDCPPYLP